MAKRNSTKLTSAELDDLKEVGWSDSTPFNIPENVSPVLKAKIIAQYSEQEGIQNPATDLPDATYRQNEIVRQRVAAEEDGKPVAKRQGEV